jgi:hypothetical protein
MRRFVTVLTAISALFAVGFAPAPAIAANEDAYYSDLCIAQASAQADRYEEEGQASGQDWTDLFSYFLTACQPLPAPRPKPAFTSVFTYCSTSSDCVYDVLATRIQHEDDD